MEEQKKTLFHYEFLVIFGILILMSLVILTMKMMIPMLVINGNKILAKGPMLTSLLALMMMTMMTTMMIPMLIIMTSHRKV